MPPRFTRLVLTAASLVALSACGSASSSSSGASAASTTTDSGATGTMARADYIKQANAICQMSSTDVKAAATAPGDPAAATADQLPAWADYFSKVNPILAAEAQSLAGLPAPDTDADRAGAALSGFAALIMDVSSAQSAAKTSDLAGFKAAMAKLATDTTAANAAAKAAGLDVCANG